MSNKWAVEKRARLIERCHERDAALVARQEGVAVATVYAYRKRPPSYEPVHGGGRKAKMSPTVMETLKQYIELNPTATRREAPRLYDISRATKKLGFVLRFTTKKIIGVRNEAQRILWWQNTIVDIPKGICNIAVECLIDLDEMGVDIASTKRRRGHSLPGVSVRVQTPSSSKRLNLLMAADVNIGAIGAFVFPAIRGQKRICLMDNHQAHLDASIFNLVEQEGHLLLRRPTSSPDFAWIEPCFSIIKEHLRAKQDMITDSNLQELIYAETGQITGPVVQHLAAGCHYLVPGNATLVK
ncbi:hypothetical protein Pelo_17993 [Pelomyxa schiedti]|nr:hypothetical protein Pelo_17993 [Pelomyxa schiedti]